MKSISLDIMIWEGKPTLFVNLIDDDGCMQTITTCPKFLGENAPMKAHILSQHFENALKGLREGKERMKNEGQKTMKEIMGDKWDE